MSKNQQFIVWVGLIIVGLYLFTDRSFRDSLFGRGTGATTTNTTNAFLTSLTQQLGSSGLPQSAAKPAASNSGTPTIVGGHTYQVN